MAKKRFRYTAVNAEGKEVKGVVAGENEEAANQSLRARGLFPTVLALCDESGPKRPERKAAANSGFKRFVSRYMYPRIKRKTLCSLTRRMAALLRAGMPLARALRLLQKQSGDPNVNRIFSGLAAEIEGGRSFSEALQSYPGTFDKLYVNMVRAGEASGALDGVLRRQADYLEKSQKLRRKIKSALTYPLIVLFVATVITSGLMVFIVPKFAAVFSDLLGNYPMPRLTLAVINLSDFMVNHFVVVALLACGIAAAVKSVRSIRAGMYLMDRAFLKMPPMGRLMTFSCSSQLCETLGTLMNAGVPIVNAMEITGGCSGNSAVKSALSMARESVKNGDPLSQGLAGSKLFPPVMLGMIEVGEESGALPEMLEYIAKDYSEEVDSALESLVSIIEPAMMVGLAVVVGTIVIALFLPLLTILNVL